jgi:hypothetical protein
LIERAFAVRLAIPDNEAYTALVTLQRLGVACEVVARADVHVFGVEDESGDELAQIIPTIATIYNPNKHRLLELSEPRPAAGEVWITSQELPAQREEFILGGVRLPGVRTVWQATSWRLLDASGNDVAPSILDQAIETLLCNPAFQRAIKS